MEKKNKVAFKRKTEAKKVFFFVRQVRYVRRLTAKSGNADGSRIFALRESTHAHVVSATVWGVLVG